MTEGEDDASHILVKDRSLYDLQIYALGGVRIERAGMDEPFSWKASLPRDLFLYILLQGRPVDGNY